jgi:hypothetical protein
MIKFAHQSRRAARQLLVLLSMAFVLAACSSGTGGFPQVAYPPPFDYADGEELRSRMHQLAFELQQLDLSLATEYDGGSGFQQEISSHLEDIERIAGVLQTGDLATRHSFLQNNMANFLADVRRASRDAELNPPRYYMAGRVSGSCVSCHRSVQ